MTEKVYYGPTIDLDKTKVVSDEEDRKILGWVHHLEIHRREIEDWFCILDTVDSLKRHLVKRSLAIEIDEFVLGCRRLYNEINRAVEDINEMYQSKGKDAVLHHVDRSIKKNLNDTIFDSIEKARNQIAAHRYTDDKGDFITIGQAIHHYNQLSDANLNAAWNIAKSAFEELKTWTEEKINRNHLVLLKA